MAYSEEQKKGSHTNSKGYVVTDLTKSEPDIVVIAESVIETIQLPKNRAELVAAWRDKANDVFCERIFKDNKDNYPLTGNECFEVLIRMIKHYNSGYNGR